ncbi:MAG: hypothetical protein CVT48_05125 [Thermoplasmata archaeon HGW-Thermoplasmata-1]|nr:MAG: hypothetical protein CVT48_05125 [Thermoplasmata archaeon HGW-Thermoplasmata-1]
MDTNRRKKHPFTDEGISPITIGILMLAVTVILAGAVWLLVAKQNAPIEIPSVAIEAGATGDTSCKISLTWVSNEGMAWSEVEVKLFNLSAVGTPEMTPPAVPSGTISEGDSFVITGLNPGSQYRVTIYHIATGGSMTTVKWTQ